MFGMRASSLFLIGLMTAAFGCGKRQNDARQTGNPGMAWIPGGQFSMGAAEQCNTGNAQPWHAVQVDGFWMDETEVTNDQFAAFVEATGYVTLAERPVNWEEMRKQVPPGTPKPA